MADGEKSGTADEGTAQPDQGCPVKMHDGKPCGRPIYNAPQGADEQPVCLMHSRDPNKRDEEFQNEFERVLGEAGEGVADFMHFVFPRANYVMRTFEARCIFHLATFTPAANFIRATFTPAANFIRATFTPAANFHGAWFTQAAEFSLATFTQAADFIRATFAQAANFPLATFKEGVEFRETKFREDAELLPGPVFVLTRFEKPEAVVFYQTYLGQALFHNCDVSKLTFSNVRWRERENGKRLVFEELVDLNEGAATDLRPPEGSRDERNYPLIAEIYQQLKKNYDDRRDYWTAGDFHYGIWR